MSRANQIQDTSTPRWVEAKLLAKNEKIPTSEASNTTYARVVSAPAPMPITRPSP
jgi:hypothetical protein